jgi:hypothetical protein
MSAQKVVPIGAPHHKVQSKDLFKHATNFEGLISSTRPGDSRPWAAMSRKQRNVTDTGWIFYFGYYGEVHVHDQEIFLRNDRTWVVTATGQEMSISNLSVRRELNIELLQHLQQGKP